MHGHLCRVRRRGIVRAAVGGRARGGSRVPRANVHGQCLLCRSGGGWDVVSVLRSSDMKFGDARCTTLSSTCYGNINTRGGVPDQQLGGRADAEMLIKGIDTNLYVFERARPSRSLLYKHRPPPPPCRLACAHCGRPCCPQCPDPPPVLLPPPLPLLSPRRHTCTGTRAWRASPRPPPATACWPRT